MLVKFTCWEMLGLRLDSKDLVMGLLGIWGEEDGTVVFIIACRKEELALEVNANV